MKRIGVVGAGTMGAGIAQVAAQAGLQVRLYDVGAGPLAAGLGRIQSGLERLVQRGKLPAAERDAIIARITTTESLADFADCEIVVEAAPEVIELKAKIFGELDAICPASTILATNTSSLSVTEIAAVTQRPALVVGMHFFNPVPLMRLVEVASGPRTSPEAAAAVTALAERLGKTPVQAKDTPGFIVNRIARPFSGEGLRIYGEGGATVRQIDRIAKLVGGFRMGPFELMDLVGMDINFAVNKSVFEQYFGEPRYRPHPLQAQMVKANLLGRKTGAGWYRYEGDAPVDGPAGPEFAGKPGPRLAPDCRVWVNSGDWLAQRIQEVGYTLTFDSQAADVAVVYGAAQAHFREETLVLVAMEGGGFAWPGPMVWFSGVPALAQRQLVELAAGRKTPPEMLAKATTFFQSLGMDVEVVKGRPGMVAARMIACIINEACFAFMEGIASAEDIDTAMKLGVNYPHGPLEWAEMIGLDRVLRLLKGLQIYTGDDRYRPCPLLEEMVKAGDTFYP